MAKAFYWIQFLFVPKMQESSRSEGAHPLLGASTMSEPDEKPEISPAGSRILRHAKKESDWKPPAPIQNLEEISQHILANLGESKTVFHENVSDTVHIDVHLVEPSARAPFYRLVTSGMSDLPMNVPQELNGHEYLELMVTLPSFWRMDMESFQDEKWYWPLRLLKGMALFPHKHSTWLGFGHSVPNANPPKSFSRDTHLCGVILLPSVTAPQSFLSLKISPQKRIGFLSLYPLYREELEFKLKAGTDRLGDRLFEAGATDLIDPQRKSVVQPKKKFWLF